MKNRCDSVFESENKLLSLVLDWFLPEFLKKHKFKQFLGLLKARVTGGKPCNKP